MANGWTPERRARQAQLIRTWAPWKKSTGPRTVEGKARVSGNAEKHGIYSARWREAEKAIKTHLRKLRRIGAKVR